MIRKSIAALFALGVFVCVCGRDAAAQSSQACGIGWFCTDYGGGPAGPCAPTPPPTGVFVGAETPGTFLYSVATSACYSGDPNEACPRCAAAGKPINLADGNTFIAETDVSVPGLGGGLSLVRTWNSQWPSSLNTARVGLFGAGWRSTYEERVFTGSDGYYKYARGDGSVWSLGFASSLGETLTQARFKYQAVSPANGGGGASLTITVTSAPASLSWPLTFGNGEQRLFDNNSGKLVAIVDRNGNKTQISYDSSGRLATVTDPAG